MPGGSIGGRPSVWLSRLPEPARCRSSARGLLGHDRGRDDVIVLARARGDVRIGYEVAMALPAPLEVFLVRKLGVPGHVELAMGALASWWWW
jgi:predicted phosphoribosyltransferase